MKNTNEFTLERDPIAGITLDLVFPDGCTWQNDIPIFSPHNHYFIELLVVLLLSTLVRQ